MDVLGAAMRAAEIHFVEREGRIRHHDGGKAQIACGACAGFDRVVGADADDHQVRDTARMQPALEASVDEGVRDVLLDHVLMGQWLETESGERLMWRTLTTGCPATRQAVFSRAIMSSAVGLLRGGRIADCMPCCMSMMIRAGGWGMRIPLYLDR
jgi:hypothetical protein